MKKLLISLLIISTVLLCGCTDNNNSLDVEQPEKIATGDQIFSAKNENAVEESDNVNDKENVDEKESGKDGKEDGERAAMPD